MWHLSRTVQMQRARLALKQDRLDDAYHIVIQPELREHHPCQAMLAALVPRFLARAKVHARAERLEDALADIAKAQEAGGNQPEVAALRQAILAQMKRAQQLKHQQKKALSSVRRHVKAGRLAMGEKKLAAAPLINDDDEKANALKKQIETMKQEAHILTSRITECLKQGNIEEALEKAMAIRPIAGGQPEVRDLVNQAAQSAESVLGDAFTSGRLDRARGLLARLEKLLPGKPHLQPWHEAMALADQAAQAMARCEWTGSRAALNRLKRHLPDADWIIQGIAQLTIIEEALQDLAAGPLGDALSFGDKPMPMPGLDSGPLSAIGADDSDLMFHPDAEPPIHAPKDAAPARPGRQTVLWVDGVGSYLLMPSEQITVGRAGASAHPDIAIPSDLEGIHARILRVDHDYFLIPQGPCTVNGQDKPRHLLTDGDRIVLGSRGHMTFRLPTALSTTAILELNANLRLSGDVRHVVLLDSHLIFGPPGNGHIPLQNLSDRIVLSGHDNGFRCRSPQPITVDGKSAGQDTLVPENAQIVAGPLTFTLTSCTAEGGIR